MDKKYDVIIFGAGIAGLTVAHELSKNNLKIAIIEKENIIGGMARTSRYSDNMPTEHSWRGYAPFYNNTYQLMKEIHTNLDKTVYDNLINGINFISLENNINHNKKVSFSDNCILFYWILYHILSGNLRSMHNKEQSFRNKVYSKISTNAKKQYIASIGPGLGLDAYAASIYHIGKYFEMSYFNDNKTNWYFMNQPTSEAWFDPWYNHLKKNNIDFYLSNELQELEIINNTTVSATVNNKKFYADNYVIAMNPFAVANLYKNNKLGKDTELDKFINITKGGPHIQISFRIGFSEKINMLPKDAFIFADSKLNLTLYQQDNFWLPNTDLGTNIKSLWSGTACVTYEMSELYNKECSKLTKEEFLNEVLHEISNCNELDEYLVKHNNKKFKELNIIKKEIWYEWEFKNNQLESRNEKWVNTIAPDNNNRPLYTTKYNNVFIAGSHCNTGLSIWSMESATESGKRCAIKILKKLKLTNNVQLFRHDRPLTIIHILDDILYRLYLPNLLDILSIVIIFFILYILYVKFIKK